MKTPNTEAEHVLSLITLLPVSMQIEIVSRYIRRDNTRLLLPAVQTWIKANATTIAQWAKARVGDTP